MIRLDILSDPVCPWCYIGKAQLDAALADRPGHPFVIEWHPFQLNPDMPAEGADRRTYLETKFGGPDQARAVYDRIRQAAQAAGLTVDFERIERMPNTLDAHRLIHWSALEGRQHDLVGRLFHAFFAEGRDIGTHEVLADVAVDAGLDRKVILSLLGSDADRDATLARDVHARERGVSGVPTFIVAERHVVPGAQSAALWRDVVDELTGAGQPVN